MPDAIAIAGGHEYAAQPLCMPKQDAGPMASYAG